MIGLSANIPQKYHENQLENGIIAEITPKKDRLYTKARDILASILKIGCGQCWPKLDGEGLEFRFGLNEDEPKYSVPPNEVFLTQFTDFQIPDAQFVKGIEYEMAGKMIVIGSTENPP